MYLFHVLFINQFHVSLVERMWSVIVISCQVLKLTLGGMYGLKCVAYEVRLVTLDWVWLVIQSAKLTICCVNRFLPRREVAGKVSSSV